MAFSPKLGGDRTQADGKACICHFELFDFPHTDFQSYCSRRQFSRYLAILQLRVTMASTSSSSSSSSPKASAMAHMAKTPLISTGASNSGKATITEQIVDGEIDTTDTKARYLALLGALQAISPLKKLRQRRFKLTIFKCDRRTYYVSSPGRIRPVLLPATRYLAYTSSVRPQKAILS